MKKFGTSNKDVIVSVVAEADKKVMDKNNMRDGFKFVMEAKVSISNNPYLIQSMVLSKSHANVDSPLM